MRILKRNKLKWEIKSIIAYGIALLLAIICGIVLFKLNNISSYVCNFADVYVFYVFNFKNGSLFFSHFLSELFYLYIAFLICRFTKLKFLVYPIYFIRALFFTLYAAILFSFFATEGVIVALIVFIPSFLLSTFFYILVCEQSKLLCPPYSYLCPAVLALVNSLIFLLLINVVFRLIVVIV